jgi:hypothetical protein
MTGPVLITLEERYKKKIEGEDPIYRVNDI